MLERLFGTGTGILSLAVLIVSVAIIGPLFYMVLYPAARTEMAIRVPLGPNVIRQAVLI